MKQTLLFLSLFCGISTIAQTTVTYDVPIGSTIGLELTSGDICTAPFNVEEAKQMSIGNSWGGTWTSTNAGTASSIEVQLAFSVGDSVSMHTTTLNGTANNTVNSGAAVNCAQGALLTWSLDPTNYVSMGQNTFLVDYANSGIINQVDNLPYAGDPYLRVTVVYNEDTSGIDTLDGDTPTLVKVTDLLGRETKIQANTPQLYVYSDGSVKQKMITE